GVALSGDGTLLASGGPGGSAGMWDTPCGACPAVPQGRAPLVFGAAPPGGSRPPARTSADGAVRLAGTPARGGAAEFPSPPADVRGVALSGEGKLWVSGCLAGRARFWETRRRECLVVVEGHTAGVRDVALSADGKLLVTSGLDGSVRLWETHSRAGPAILEGH